jgi:hypothetical protein
LASTTKTQIIGLKHGRKRGVCYVFKYHLNIANENGGSGRENKAHTEAN